MSNAPFWKQLIPNDELEAQLKLLLMADGDMVADALRLARFAEARMYERARLEIEARDKRIAELEKKIAAIQAVFAL